MSSGPQLPDRRNPDKPWSREPVEDYLILLEVPASPGCITEGDNNEDAISNAKEATELFIETLNDIGKSIPEDMPLSDIRRV